MASTIEVLDPLEAQQVAAGEVVDRPASVVKELAENALDAGATRIEVEIADGGRERILVRDDGSGMSEEDAKLSVLRHATSKIRTATDIESVMTLGFRGEALPSIASVCAFSLTTSTGEGAGTNVTTDGGGNVTVSPASHSRGTTVFVDRLFYNVPARRAPLVPRSTYRPIHTRIGRVLGFGPTISSSLRRTSLLLSFFTMQTFILWGPSPCKQECAISPSMSVHNVYP